MKKGIVVKTISNRTIIISVGDKNYDCSVSKIRGSGTKNIEELRISVGMPVKIKIGHNDSIEKIYLPIKYSDILVGIIRYLYGFCKKTPRH